MDYYDVLGLNYDCTKEEIKKQYRKLCLKYHPDKNNGKDKEFKRIKEAYETLYDDDQRKKYNFQKLFGYKDFTDEEFKLLDEYYEKIVNSNEFKLMKLLYKSIPDNIKEQFYQRFKQSTKNTKQIIRSNKTIDITQLNDTFTVNLIISKKDKQLKSLKIIHILSKNGIYYLYLRDFDRNLKINNYDCTLNINFL